MLPDVSVEPPVINAARMSPLRLESRSVKLIPSSSQAPASLSKVDHIAVKRICVALRNTYKFGKHVDPRLSRIRDIVSLFPQVPLGEFDFRKAHGVLVVAAAIYSLCRCTSSDGYLLPLKGKAERARTSGKAKKERGYKID